MTAFILLGGAYLVGSLPIGLWLARTQGVDLRAVGSRNVGATNVLRALGRTFAVLVLILDAAKGAAAVVVARISVDDPWVIVGCAVAVVVGHMWPVWAGFRGGKGVATLAGAYGALVPVSLLWPAVLFVCVVAMSRYVSLASMAAAVALPVAIWLFDGERPATIGAVVLAALVIWRHGGNIGRLISGNESRVGERIVAGRRRGPFVA